MDLSNLSVRELNRLAKEAIETAQFRQKEGLIEAKRKARELLKPFGIKVHFSEKPSSEMAEMRPKNLTKKVVQKYGHPEDSSKTWSGRGIKPLWVKELEAEGKIPELIA